MKFSILKLLIAASALLFTFPSFAGNKTGKPVFPLIEIIGTSVPSYNWVAGVDMPTTDGVTYILKNYTLVAGEVKFRQNQNWSVNWGATAFPEGIGVEGGANIPIIAGVYTIVFNRISGEYNFYNLAPARKRFVNDNGLSGDIFTTATGNNANSGTSQLPYASVQYAVQQAVYGDTIYVDAGTYTEQVTVDKAITIIGTGTSSLLTVPATPLVSASGLNPKGILQTTLLNGNVYIKNLNVVSSLANGYYGIILQSGGSIKGCTISNAFAGIFATYNSGPQSIGIYNNIITDIVAGVSCQGTQITVGAYNNEITLKNGSSAGFFVGIEYGPIKAFSAGNNIISNYGTYGLQVNSGKTFLSNNSITGTNGNAIVQVTGAQVTASCNWFGTANADTIKSRMSGNIDYSPWLSSGTDTSLATGFQSTFDCAGWRTNDYVFSGNGNWSNPANWVQNKKPPVVLPMGSKIVINPTNGQCTLDDSVRISSNSIIDVKPGKKFIIPRNLSLIYDKSILLKDNVHVIDSNAFVLASTDAMLAAGVYRYTGTTARSFANNDILVGLTGDGYLRKVTSFSIAGNVYTFQTSQGNMEDVFKQGNFDFAAATDASLQKAASSTSVKGYTFNIDDIVLFDDGVGSIKLTNGSVTLNPNWRGAFEYGLLGLKYFELAFKNATVESSFKLAVSLSQAVGLPETTKSLKKLNAKIPIPGVPIVVVMSLDFIAKYAWQIQAAMTRNIDFNFTNTVNLSVKYKDGNWQNTFDVDGNKSIVVEATTANINATINAAIIPTFNFKFYNVVGPSAAFAMSTQANANIGFPSLDWDFWAGAWLKTSVGVNAGIFGRSIYSSPTADWYTETLFYRTPDNLVKTSGDNQTGDASQFLSQPVVVRVIDNFGIKQKNVSVNFKVKSGGGTLESTTALTNDDGYAQTRWKLGSTACDIQKIEVSAKKADGSLLKNAPMEFTATSNVFKITGASISGWTNIGTVCASTFYKSGNALTTISFSNAVPPTGSILWTIKWDNQGDGFFEGGGAFNTIDIANLSPVGNTVSIGNIGYCWGPVTTVLKLVVQYVSPSGCKSDFFETIVPKP